MLCSRRKPCDPPKSSTHPLHPLTLNNDWSLSNTDLETSTFCFDRTHLELNLLWLHFHTTARQFVGKKSGSQVFVWCPYVHYISVHDTYTCCGTSQCWNAHSGQNSTRTCHGQFSHQYLLFFPLILCQECYDLLQKSGLGFSESEYWTIFKSFSPCCCDPGSTPSTGVLLRPGVKSIPYLLLWELRFSGSAR